MKTPKPVAGSRRHPLPGSRAIGPVDPAEWIRLTLKVRRRAALPEIASRPQAALSREDLAEKYGADPADVAKIRDAMERAGLDVVDENPGSRTVKVEGPADTVQHVFGVNLIRYAHAEGEYRGRIGEVHVPSEVTDLVVGVFGLDNRRMVRRRATAASTIDLAAPKKQTRPWFIPPELASIYNFPAGDGAGQTIGILEFGGGFFADDLAAFCQATGIPNTAKVVAVSVDHASTRRRDGAEGEVMLDVEVVAGVCPKATIPVYFGKWTEQGWIDTLDKALHDTTHRPSVLSISWGLAEGEDIWTAQAIDQVNESFKEAALLGVTVCVASGDDGSDDQVGDGHAHVDFPAASPYVLAVGGTTLRVTNGQRTESVWKDGDGLRADGGGSTGGGVSDHFPPPTWQSVDIRSVNPTHQHGRTIPDVAAVASARTGYFVVVDGQAQVSGGTSASAPLWAALVARVNAALQATNKTRVVGYLTPLLYGKAAGSASTLGTVACNDVFAGDNATAAVGGYQANKGYDAVTGWGTPDGAALLQQLDKLI